MVAGDSNPSYDQSIRALVPFVALLGCGRVGFDATADGGRNGDAAVAAPRCMVPARPDVSTPRVTLGCDQIVAAQEILNGGIVRFDCATGVNLGAQILVNTDTVIDGRGVTFDGQNITRVFRVTNNARLTLLDVTVTRAFVTNESGGGAPRLGGARLV